MPFTLDTFIDHRPYKPTRVWHATGCPNEWHELRQRYHDRRQHSPFKDRLPRYTDTHEPLYIHVGQDMFCLLADTTELRHGDVRFSHAWIGFDVWEPIDPGDLVVNSLADAPPDHLSTDRYIIRGSVNDRLESYIIDEIMEDTGLPYWLLEYQEDPTGTEYEVAIVVPKAQTIWYDRLREAHHQG